MPNEPWLFIGDLNLILHEHEKEGGAHGGMVFRERFL